MHCTVETRECLKCGECGLALPPGARFRDLKRHHKAVHRRKREGSGRRDGDRSGADPPASVPPSAPAVNSLENRDDRGLASADKSTVLRLSSDSLSPILLDLQGRPAIVGPVAEAPSREGTAPERTSDKGACAETLPSNSGEAVAVPSITKKEHQRPSGAKRKSGDKSARSDAPVPIKKARPSHASSRCTPSEAMMHPPPRPPRTSRARPGASLIRRVVDRPLSDVEPDDYFCVGPTRRATIPAALGAPSDVCITVSDDEERSSSVLGTTPVPSRSPALPNRMPDDPLSSGGLDDESPSSPPPLPSVSAPRRLDVPRSGVSSKGNVVCPCCPARFLGIDARMRLKSHIELHFSSSAATAPCTPGLSFASLHAPSTLRRRAGEQPTPRIVFRPELIEPLQFPTYISTVSDDARPLDEEFGEQLELVARFCRALVGTIPAAEILMRGMRIFPGFPSNIMRRVLRSFYDEDGTDRVLFVKNQLPIYLPGTTVLATSTVEPDAPDIHRWGDMIDLRHVDEFRQ